MPLEIDIDDDDTTPTENAAVLRELTATLAAYPLGVVSWSAATTPGTRRRVNEDAWGRRDDVFVVADGMGGRGGGALAARTAIDRLLERARTAGPQPDWRDVVEAVNADVLGVATERGIERVGTTLLATAVGGPLVTLIHLGDSRAYRLTRTTDGVSRATVRANESSSERGNRERRASERISSDGRLDLLTHDHTVRAELLAAGLDVRDYRDRGVALHGLTSFIGLEHEVLRIDVLAVPVRAGDRVLLCTDGVYRQLDDDQLRRALRTGTTRDAAEALVEQADEAGGRDNATAVVVEVGVTSGFRSDGGGG